MKKIVFIHNPKVAGTSIRKSLKQLGIKNNLKVGSSINDDIIILPERRNNLFEHPYDLPNDSLINEYQLNFNKTFDKKAINEISDIFKIYNVLKKLKYNNCYIFMFFRSPVSRIISAYNHNLRRNKSNDYYFKIDSTNETLEKYIKKVVNFRKINKIKNYDSFLFKKINSFKNLKKTLIERMSYFNNLKKDYNITEYDLHHSVNDQIDLVPNYYKKYYDIGELDPKLKLNFIGNFDNLKSDWNTLIKNLNLKYTPLCYENKGNYKKVTLPDHLIKKINDSFYKDLSFYNEI